MIAIAAGFAVATVQPILIPVAGCISVALLALLILCFSSVKFKHALGFFLLALIYVNTWVHFQKAEQFPERLNRTDWMVSGTVTDLTTQTGQSQRFNLELSTIQSVDSFSTNALGADKLRLSLFKEKFLLQSGDQVELVVRLKAPHTLLNPGGFDYERWLFTKGIDATGYVREIRRVDRREQTRSPREWISSTLHEQLEDQRLVGLLHAISIGEKQGISQPDWDKLKASGTLHLAVISGLHIGFMAFVGWWLGRGLSLFKIRYAFALPYIVSLSLAGSYMLVSGLGVPAQRAFIMLLALLGPGLFQLQIPIWTRWWVALIVVLIFSPLGFTETGVWLSFGAVATLIWLSQYQFNWRNLLKLQLALLIGMLPLYLYFFAGVSLVAPLVNLLAIPLFSLIVPILFFHLLLSLLGWSGLLPVIEFLLRAFWWLVDYSASGDYAYLDLGTPGIWGLVACSCAVVLLLIPRGLLPRWIAFIFLLPAMSGFEPTPQLPDGYTARIYDVGQGLTVVVETANQVLVYDTGLRYRNGDTVFERAVLPDLSQRGIEKVDALVISHDDIDHAGGLGFVIHELDVARLITSYAIDKDQLQSAVKCKAGMKWQYDGVSFEFLAGSEGRNDNDRSCVLRVDNGQCSLLLPGDISELKERELVNQNAYVQATWLVLAHHGSKTSTSDDWLKQVQPQLAIATAGYANHFGHPHTSVTNRLSLRHIPYLNTADEGMITLTVTTDQCEIDRMRETQKRLWRY